MSHSVNNYPEFMSTMRITAHGGLEKLESERVNTPAPAPGEVLVKVSSVALNNTDLWTRQGSYGLPGDPQALAGWRGEVQFPRIQGADVAGYVVATGSEQDEHLLGVRVVIDPAIYESEHPDAHPIGLLGSERDGGYAEYVTAPVNRVHDVTASPLTDDQLTSLPTAYGTALGMIERGRMRQNSPEQNSSEQGGLASQEVVVVTGASGGVGMAAVQIARARGAFVIAISSTGKLQAVKEAGADVVINREGDIAQELSQAAPEGIDIVLDVVAGDLVAQAIPQLKEGGRWVIAGALAGYSIELDVRRLYLHNAQIIGSSMHTPAHFHALMEMARGGQIDPIISAVYPLSQAREAQEELGRRNHIGKIVMHPSTS